MRPGPEDSQLMVGLEIHQQLSTSTKLFCSCPPVKSEEFPFSFTRRLRPAQGETGRIDPAAVFEFAKGKANMYLWNPESSCLVDADEEPPHPANEEAIDTVLKISKLLGSRPVDEAHVMRKIVIDGSNTSGFQRTAIIGLGGLLRVDGKEVGVQSITLEEDAARIMGEDGDARMFALDRLGVPLVEIALDPVTGSPEFVGSVALALGRSLRSTGRVARGLGTIRQDLNVSLRGGAVVEVKGVQKLSLVSKVVSFEAGRQAALIELAAKVKATGVRKVTCTTEDVTGILANTSSPVLRKVIAGGGNVACVCAAGLAGMLAWEPLPGARLGREVADVARANGLRGAIHSDEFAKQGVSSAEEVALRKKCGALSGSALVLVAGPSERVRAGAKAIMARLAQVVDGVPAETRQATDLGETAYMRPRPGAQRMYPETDIPEIPLGPARVREATREMQERWEDAVDRYVESYSISRDLALRLYDSDASATFEALSKELKLEPSLIASTLVELPVRLSREGMPEETLGQTALSEVLRAVDSGLVAKEAAPEILRAIGAGRAKTVAEAVGTLGLKALGEQELAALIRELVARKAPLIREKGEGAFSPLMGEVMAEVRGKADGAIVGRLLRGMISDAIEKNSGT